MSICAKISTNTIEDLEKSYNKFKDQILEKIYKEYLIKHISLEDLKNQFINNKPHKESLIKNKKKQKKIVIKNRCYAYVWKNGEKKQCCNKKSEGSQYCLRHLNNRFYGSIKYFY